MLETDAVVIGAGPVGLFQVFQLGLLEIKAHVIDSLPHPGGQCVELYPDKPIYDIPAVLMCTGQELADRLLQQIEPFGATFHFNQEVSSIEKQTDGRFLLATSKGKQLLTKTIFIAAGVGAFQPRAIKVEGLDTFGTQIFYRMNRPADFAGQRVMVIGGDDTAVRSAIELAEAGEHVTLLHRRDVLQAAPSYVDKMRALCQAGKMQFVLGQATGFEEQGGRLIALKIIDPDGSTSVVSLDALLVYLGLSPKLGPIAQWGLDLERKQLKVDTEQFSTSEPGIFAVGDINIYPGKKKLILSGFHECALAAFGAAPIIFPDKKIFLQYTTTSPRLHKLLGKTPDANPPPEPG